MKRSPHPCGQRGSREGGEKTPLAALTPLSRHSLAPKIPATHPTLAIHQPPATPAPSARPRRSLAHTHTHTHAPPLTRMAPAHTPPDHHHEVGTPPCFFLRPVCFHRVGWYFFYSRAGGEGGYNGGDTMRGKQYGKNKYFLECKFNLCSSLKFC